MAGRLGAGSSSAVPVPDIELPPVKLPTIFHSPEMAPYVDDLRVPSAITSSPSQPIEIIARTTSSRFHRDQPKVPTMAYNDESYLGPTIEAHVGEQTTVHYRSELGKHIFAADLDTSLHGVAERYRDEPVTSMHLHGGATPPEFDGNPERLMLPHHGTALFEFPNRQEAGHLWYHDHAMAITRANVYAGLAGMYFLRDDHDTGTPQNPLGLPAGEYEIPLILQEKIFRPDGHQSLRSTPVVPQGMWEGGAVGDRGLVNGKVWPKMTVARGLYRFRLINAASFSVWNLFFSNRMRFWVIGNEGGLLNAPVATRSFQAAPGERFDLLVDFGSLAPGETVDLCNDLVPPFQAAILAEVAMPRFCRFIAGADRGHRRGVPTRLRGGHGQPRPVPPIATPTRVRRVSVSQPYALRVPPAIMSLNNLRYSDPQIEKPRAGTTERWDIINITPDPHPVHLHLVMFRVLGRRPLRTVEYQAAHPQPPLGTRWAPDPSDFYAGPMRGPAAWEAGWKDTVHATGGHVTSIIVRFPTADELGFDPDAIFSSDPTQSWTRPSLGQEADRPAPSAHHNHAGATPAHGMVTKDLQGYVWHCHILDHEDHDMMLRYRVVP
ncbi:multicopper oxidase family protein [Gordonia amicalis]|uniref:Multicopper oxidase domain-containing protein n=1 Tax=Gordonia amicalis TaxID=89053 RepID=A0AAE4R9Y8_9ACTN|nr:multicopper oxidase domain-containing protein [Gordonia amicalis]MCZ4581204.1 multicopper oxidase domain-containing protein [Gordonia amicalis]MCZ4652894.1 multicopper oxidase domain-containing protein [Gordonia amicalis]MDJ0453647.1 multicopper oxidase domain-containing protein [Gordonia amicalis]MDV6308507.1 multicopper oxidase domain-containing protein [Gordonia amicalis]MDV6313496.1 multicopper oxidase domain-containing protein [Gordonia amicalis]